MGAYILHGSSIVKVVRLVLDGCPLVLLTKVVCLLFLIRSRKGAISGVNHSDVHNGRDATKASVEQQETTKTTATTVTTITSSICACIDLVLLNTRVRSAKSCTSVRACERVDSDYLC